MESVKVTFRELQDLWLSLHRVGEMALPIKPSYAIARTKKSIRDDVTSLEESTKLKDGAEAFDKLRMDLVKTMALTDPDGQPVVMGGGVQMKDRVAFELAFSELKAKEGEKYAEYEKQHTANFEFLKKDTEVKVHLLKIASLEHESIPPIVLEGLMPMLVDDDSDD